MSAYPNRTALPHQLLTTSGGLVDLLAPRAEDLNLRADMPGVLARIARFNGHPPAGPYSVAQHTVLGTRALLDETGDARLAQVFLLHDAHEYLMGDLTRPAHVAIVGYMAAAMQRHMQAQPLFRGDINQPEKLGAVADFALRHMKSNLDMAIHKAAGAPLPNNEEATIVADMDTRMLRAEADALFASRPSFGAAVEQARPVPLRGRIKAWPWPRAADALTELLDQLCPSINERK